MAESASDLSPDVKLKCFLYTASEKPTFATGNVERRNHYSPERLTCVPTYLNSSNPETLFNIIEIVHSEGLLPRRETVFFVLAVAASKIKDEVLKCRLYRTLANLMKDTKDLCTFIKFYTRQRKKFNKATNKLISSYYNGKEPLELLHEITQSNGYYTWTHKDLLKLSHFKWNGIATAVITVYILFGFKKAQLVGQDNDSVRDILSYLKKLDDMKRAEDEKLVIELIPQLHCPLARVPSIFHHSQLVWKTLLSELPLKDIIIYLPRLYKEGFINSTSFQNKLVQILTNSKNIQESRIHPVEVFIGLRNFEKGGRPMDPKLKAYLEKLKTDDPEKASKKEPSKEPVKCPNIVSALHKTMQLSFSNPPPLGRKIMITIDNTKKMNWPCLNNKNLSCLEAATIFTLSILKIERDVTVAVFNDSKINIINIEKNATFNQALNKIKQSQTNCTYCSPASPIEWATNKIKPVDVFINFLYYHHWLLLIPKELRDKESPLNHLNTYRKKMALPHSKLITFSLGSPHLQIADGSPNVMDISGFDTNVPPVVEAFSKGLF